MPNNIIITKFYVQFSDPSDLSNDPDNEQELDEDVFHGYENSIQINCPEDKFQEIIENNEKLIDQLETTYGILDYDGIGTEAGYCSYEIEMKNAPYVFQTLCDLFKEYWISNAN